jgi:hypothetical protein
VRSNNLQRINDIEKKGVEWTFSKYDVVFAQSDHLTISCIRQAFKETQREEMLREGKNVACGLL